MRRFWLGFIASYGLFYFQPAQSASFQPAVSLFEKGDRPGAYQKLKSMEDVGLTSAEQSSKYFLLGVWGQEMGLQEESVQHLQTAMRLDAKKATYAHFVSGKIFRAKGYYSQAESDFKKVLQLKPPAPLQYETRYEMAEMAAERKMWAQAAEQFTKLEKKWRNSTRHAEVLWKLIKVELHRGKKNQVCRWTRKLYAQYPTHPLVYDWSIDLHDVSYEGQKLNCLASNSDRSDRIRRLQLAGEPDRARREIEILRKRAGAADQYEADALLANFWVSEGSVEEAHKLLGKHYKAQGNKFSYLMLLAKAAASAGEFQVAVAAYERAYRVSPKSKAGKKALFQAAFLSYQFQDYDGASRKFDEFIKRYRSSGLARDAQWNLAWIRYLKGDHYGAIQGFKDILNERKRSPRLWRSFQPEKIYYWTAMSYVRLENIEMARQFFKTLADDKTNYGYYAMAARNRLSALPEESKRMLSAAQVRSKPTLEGPLPEPALPNSAQATGEENESEDTLTITREDEQSGDTTVAQADDDKGQDEPSEGGEEEEEGEGEADSVITRLGRPSLQRKFELAQELMTLGQRDWAKWELFEIEGRTRRSQDLRKLLVAYDSLHFYNRQAYLGEIYFGGERRRQGFETARQLWEATYPKAYENEVRTYAQKFNVAPEFIWAIMRAESNYKPDIVSPVGARGLMQVMPYTGRQLASLIGDIRYQERDLFQPETNIKLGGRYLARLLKKFNNQIPLAAAGYNAGPHRVDSWLSSFGRLDMDEFIEHIPYIETRNYVKKVVQNFGLYNQLYNSNKEIKNLTWLAQPVPVRISKRPSFRENWESVD